MSAWWPLFTPKVEIGLWHKVPSLAKTSPCRRRRPARGSNPGEDNVVVFVVIVVGVGVGGGVAAAGVAAAAAAAGDDAHGSII